MARIVVRFTLFCAALLTTVFVSQATPPTDGSDADRAEIRAHIESIFQAFIDKDIPKLRETHAEDWRGFLEGSPVAIKGIEQYMTAIGAGPNSTGGVKNPNTGMKSFRITSYDTHFYSAEMAIICFVAEIESRTGGSSALRIMDIYAKRNGRWIQTASHTTVHPQAIAKQFAAPITLPEEAKKQLLEAREAVWRAWFSNDQAKLAELIPEDLITIERSGSSRWGTRASVLEGAKRFAESGIKLTRLEFPRTEIQAYGRTVIIYTTYSYDLDNKGQKSTSSGRATEIFVYRDGKFVNTGWHLDRENLTAEGQ